MTHGVFTLSLSELHLQEELQNILNIVIENNFSVESIRT